MATSEDPCAEVLASRTPQYSLTWKEFVVGNRIWGSHMPVKARPWHRHAHSMQMRQRSGVWCPKLRTVETIPAGMHHSLPHLDPASNLRTLSGFLFRPFSLGYLVILSWEMDVPGPQSQGRAFPSTPFLPLHCVFWIAFFAWFPNPTIPSPLPSPHLSHQMAMYLFLVNKVGLGSLGRHKDHSCFVLFQYRFSPCCSAS